MSESIYDGVVPSPNIMGSTTLESEYDVVIRRQSVNFINSTLGNDPELAGSILPLDSETEDLYQAMRSGVLILWVYRME